MSVTHKPIALRIDWLMEHARQYSTSFSSAEAVIARQRYMAEHPSAIAALKCMDGRINLSVGTHTPSGIINANMRAGRIPDDGFLLLAEETYREIGGNRTSAELRSRFLSGFAANIIRTNFPKLAEKMHVRIAVLNWQWRAMEMIDGSVERTDQGN